MVASIDLTITFEPPDEDGWIVARVLEVPGAMSQGRSRDEARENALEALSTVLTPDQVLAGETEQACQIRLDLPDQRSVLGRDLAAVFGIGNRAQQARELRRGKTVPCCGLGG